MVLSEAAASGDGHGKQHAVATEGENDFITRHRCHYVLPQTWQYFSRGVILPSSHFGNDCIYELHTCFKASGMKNADYKIMAEAIGIHHN